MKIINPDKCVVFFDFDNTISTCDVFDNMLPRFSRDDLWVSLEKKWKKGHIGSRACLEGQIKGLSIDKVALNKYLSGIKLDPYFRKIVNGLSASGVKIIVLSDNFDYILKRIFKLNGIKGLKVYSNKLKLGKDALIPIFPYTSDTCHICAHCKTKNLLANIGRDSIIIYIGDGRSDVCPAQYADIVFAKDELLEFFKERKMTCFAYKSLKDAYDFFKRSFA
ncbi:MAG: MtnX-like HAD-IB family phosphatase [Candidatus Omnitrophica bacterium]|nr:MtnX-like HAD-IB family phosphatase [Candidatus Omnitrophota bacterium]